MTIYPAPEPAPALRYRLFPSQMDRSLGNAALTYYRCLSPDWFTLQKHPGMYNTITEALKAPLNQLPRKEVDWVLHTHQLKELDRAARQEYSNWEFLARGRQDGLGLLLPEIQAFRGLGPCLGVRARLELADGQFDQSVFTLQTAFSLAYDIGNTPVAINALVGIAIAQVALDQVREFVQQPGAPNLYWALATIPRPFINWPKIIEAEQSWLYASIPLLRDIEKRPLSPAELAEFREQVLKLLDLSQLPSGSDKNLALTYLVLKQYPEARRALIAQGRTLEEVDAMPALQVCVIHALQQFRRLEDDQLKWYYLPADVVGTGPAMAEQQSRDAHRRLEGEPFGSFLTAYRHAHAASLRFERQTAMLRVVEAIRLHAAAHASLPPSLDALTAVPVPRDPATGKAFAYKVDGDKATLSAAPLHDGARELLVYELTLKK
jgi:hypothetical protein